MQDKIIASIYWLNLALQSVQQRSEDGSEKLYVAYSGGKDSECIAHLCMTHLPIDAIEIHYNATGIDPPEVVRHIKARFRAWRAAGVECHFDKPRANMHDQIVKRGPPTQLKRYCCEELKETASDGRVTITGVRKAESRKRAENHDILTVMSKNKALRAKYHMDNDIRTQIIEHCTLRSRLTINPILEWEDCEVWQYIRDNDIPYCHLYDEGFKRLGCIGCPMGGLKRFRDFARWPHMYRYYRKAFAAFLAKDPEKYATKYNWRTVDDMWHWWLEDGVVPGQIEMDLEDAL